MRDDASALGWGVLVAIGGVASAASVVAQLVFAAFAIGVVGLAHGASDLAIVTPGRRPAFLAAYVAVATGCLIWWLAAPAVALPFFLVASAIHFGLEDAPPQRVLERIARGLGMIVIPSTFHPGGFLALLAAAGGDPALDLPVGLIFSLPGGLLAALLLGIAARHRDARLAFGIAALLLFPPLVGFSLGFLVLHAIPQTRARCRAMAFDTMAAYVRLVAPILATAILVFGVVVGVVLRVEPTGVRALFSAIAALALPHLLVTPFYDREVMSRSGVASRMPAIGRS